MFAGFSWGVGKLTLYRPPTKKKKSTETTILKMVRAEHRFAGQPVGSRVSTFLESVLFYMAERPLGIRGNM